MEASSQGDAVANVLQQLYESRVTRKQIETKKQLDEITFRIRNTLEDYDDSSKLFGQTYGDNMKLVADMEELEGILKDGVLRNKYQQKLTIFIVGYQTLCTQRADILAQLYEFFSMYAPDNNESLTEAVSETDMESLQLSVQDALDSMESAVQKLSGVGNDVINYMERLHSATSSKSTKSKKKLEKALQNAKDEILKMTNKLLNVQQDQATAEDRLQQMRMQVDAKRAEISHLKTQMETSKKTFEKVHEGLKLEKSILEKSVTKLQMEVEALKSEVEDANKESSDAPKGTDVRLREIKDAAVIELQRLKTRMEGEQMDVPSIKKELVEQFHIQLQQINDVYEEEVENWKQECKSHVFEILEMDMGEEDVQQWTQGKGREGLMQSATSKEQQLSTYHTSSVDTEVKQTSPSEISVQVSKPLDREVEAVLMDEDSWKNLTQDEAVSRFAEFRAKARNEIARLTESTQAARAMNENLVSEATRWQEEKAALLAHIEQLKLLQEAAEADAEEAMRNLEEFAAEQEKAEAGHVSGAQVKDSQVNESDPEASQLTEDNVKAVDESYNAPSSPSSFSKPASAATSRLASAYRKKIADRRVAMKERKERLQSANTSIASPQFKGMFDTGLMEEFLRCYRAVVEFKDMISQEMSRHASHHAKAQLVNSVQTSNYDASNDEVQLYVSNMTHSVEQVLCVIQENVSLALNESRDAQNSNQLERSRLENDELRNELTNLRNEFEKRAQHDAAMIMHLQNTLSETQRGNTGLAGTSGSGFPSSPAGPIFGKTPSSSHRHSNDDANVTVMFTRIDTEHNAKELKKSAAAGRITQETLESVVMTMEAYNAIPAKRIQHLANKIVHHSKMKVIESNVRNSNLVTSEVFAVLEKMEVLQRRRAQDWSRQMDSLTSERRRLAALLSDALQRLETITGVFLIKPVISYPGNRHLRKYSGKISTRFNKYQLEAMIQKIQMKQAMAAQMPLSTVHKRSGVSSNKKSSSSTVSRPQNSTTLQLSKPPPSSNPLSVQGVLQSRGSANMWNAESSLARNALTPRGRDVTSPSSLLRSISMPKLLELDVTRYQHPSTNVHAMIGSDGLTMSGDRLKNMEMLKMRSNTIIERTGSNLKDVKRETLPPQHSPMSRASTSFNSAAPPTTPALFLQIPEEDPELARPDFADPNDDVKPPIAVFTSPIPKPLPPIRRLSARSSVTSPATTKDLSPRSERLSPSGSVPDMQVEADAIRQSTTPLSARKDIATSPVGDG